MAEFNAWLSQVTCDFAAAEYGNMSYQGVDFPTTSNSVSVLVLAFFGFASGPDRWAPIKVFAIVLLAAAGAWMGRYFHSGVASFLKTTAATAQSEPPAEPAAVCRIVLCPTCGQKLRLPIVDKLITVTCPKCQRRFDVPA